MREEAENEDDNNPWEVNLSSSVPIPRTAARATSPPTDAQRRPWVPEKKRMPEGWKPGNSRPWSTDPTLTRNGINRGSIILADGRPHTVGSLPRPAKVLSYQEAYEVSQSHSEARKIIKMQHKLINEDQHRTSYRGAETERYVYVIYAMVFQAMNCGMTSIVRDLFH